MPLLDEGPLDQGALKCCRVQVMSCCSFLSAVRVGPLDAAVAVQGMQRGVVKKEELPKSSTAKPSTSTRWLIPLENNLKHGAWHQCAGTPPHPPPCRVRTCLHRSRHPCRGKLALPCFPLPTKHAAVESSPTLGSGWRMGLASCGQSQPPAPSCLRRPRGARPCKSLLLLGHFASLAQFSADGPLLDILASRLSGCACLEWASWGAAVQLFERGALGAANWRTDQAPGCSYRSFASCSAAKEQQHALTLGRVST